MTIRLVIFVAVDEQIGDPTRMLNEHHRRAIRNGAVHSAQSARPALHYHAAQLDLLRF